MAKRRAKASRRKAGRKTSKKTTRTVSARKTSRPKARTARKASKPARKAVSKKTAPRRTAARKATRIRASGAPARQAASRNVKTNARNVSSRPKPAALARPRRQLRDDETVPGAPSSLNFAVKASAAESGHQMYNQRAKEHTEGGSRLTGGDVDADWNEAYASGEETPGGDMSTPDQDVVEEIGRALGVEYEDAEELKGADKIESRDRNRWEYDPASAEDYKDRNRRED
jgi:hypothetical protein